MKNKNFILMPLMLMLFTAGLMSQGLTFGITAGVSTSTVRVSEIGTGFTNAINGDGIIGFEGGLVARLNLGKLLYGKGLLLVAFAGGPSDFKNNNGSINRSKFSVGKLELPLLIGLKIIGPIGVEAGPVLNWIFHESHTTDEAIAFRKTGIGYRIGANVDIGVLNLGLAFQGLKNPSNGFSNATYASPSELIFSAAIMFGN